MISLLNGPVVQVVLLSRPKGHAKGKIVPVRLNDEELKLFTKAADKSEHKTLSSWIRHSLKATAEKV